MFLKDEDIGYFLGRIRSLPKSQRVILRRKLGEPYYRQPAKVKMAILYAMPDGADTNDTTLMENLFFTACVACLKKDGDREKSVRIEKALVAGARKKYTSEEIATARFSEILSLRTGMGTRLYRDIATILGYGERNVDCFSLLKDLEFWDVQIEKYRDTVQTRWAMAYTRTENNSEKEND